MGGGKTRNSWVQKPTTTKKQKIKTTLKAGCRHPFALSLAKKHVKGWPFHHNTVRKLERLFPGSRCL